ncbi:MAG: hypothetical protein A2W03_06875 [Candidatus Aminicenantes bacterium RBG_16_63_16]|nr:MAG: hypothetical protein A2W03_06875 [Candidatus Aminicenantes bacterium RBG_16_63_16]
MADAASVALLALSLCPGLAGQEARGESPGSAIILRVGYPVSAFSPGFVQDVRSLLEVWGTRLAKKYRPTGEVSIEMFEDLPSIIAALESHSLDLLVISSLDYIDLEAGHLLEPVTTEADIDLQFILVVRRDRNIREVRELAGGRCLIDGGAVGRLPQIWLDVALHRAGLPPYMAFFKDVKIRDKASQAVLPVFFGQSDAGVTTRKAFATLCELNPQLDRELTIVMSSPGMIRGLNCIRTDLEPDLKSITIKALNEMDQEPEGQQILVLLGVDKIRPFKLEYLDKVRSLYNEYKTLRVQPN